MNRLPEEDYDVIVVGSGAAGMSAALTCALRGLSTAVVESSSYFGGCTAFSGGAVWIPNHPYMRAAGLSDTLDDGRAYLQATVGDVVSECRREAYLSDGPAMLEEFENSTRWMRWIPNSVPDYRPEEPGGKVDGRSVEAAFVDASTLGSELRRLRPPSPAIDTKGVTVTAADFVGLNMVTRTRAGQKAAARVAGRYLLSRIRGQRLVGIGQALATRLRLSLQDAGVPFLYDTALKELVVEDGRVSGILASQESRIVTIRASCGVVLASGGFGKNQEMRDKYMRHPSGAEWSLVPEDGQDGSGIEAGTAVGGAVAHMQRAWGFPVALLPKGGAEGVARMALSERGLPGSLVVNDQGQRYANEAKPYEDFWEEMYYHHSTEGSGPRTIPSWLIFDQRSKNRYGFLTIPPRLPFPRAWYEKGYVRRAGNIAALAYAMGVPAGALTDTVERFNRQARAGADSDYGRGESAYDRYYGDPTLPRPNLAPLTKGPFYAVRLYPGDLGTKGGLEIDEHSRVLRADGSTIEGLYACGNCSAGVMGETYPGPGATLGPAMVAGYAAGNHLATVASQIRRSDVQTDLVITKIR